MKDESAASKLIREIEEREGSRIDDPSGTAMASLLGAMSRETGRSKQDPRDDFVAGCLIQQQSTKEYKRKKAADDLWVELFIAGLK